MKSFPYRVLDPSNWECRGSKFVRFWGKNQKSMIRWTKRYQMSPQIQAQRLHLDDMVGQSSLGPEKE